MRVLALSDQEITLWLVALAVGAVVIVAVIALLGMLLYLIRSIDAGATRLRTAAGTMAGHTHQIREVGAVDSRLQEVGQEAQRHVELFGREERR